MLSYMFEFIGIAGIAISVAAYVPQVVHLTREHCSTGISSRAWTMWLIGALFVGLLALRRGDPVFILLQASSVTSAVAILYLARNFVRIQNEWRPFGLRLGGQHLASSATGPRRNGHVRWLPHHPG
jgi:lipid-A-disaccharide synthase-like uncharacterized protein